MSFHLQGREACPRCGERVRSLRLSDEIVRHHQCTKCGYRYEDVQEATLDADGRMDGFSCLDALPEPEQEVVETLVLLMLGNATLVGALELTSRTLADLVCEHGAPYSTLRGFTYPACKWRIALATRFASYLVVIDQGLWRVCFTMRRLRPTALR